MVDVLCHSFVIQKHHSSKVQACDNMKNEAAALENGCQIRVYEFSVHAPYSANKSFWGLSLVLKTKIVCFRSHVAIPGECCHAFYIYIKKLYTNPPYDIEIKPHLFAIVHEKYGIGDIANIRRNMLNCFSVNMC